MEARLTVTLSATYVADCRHLWILPATTGKERSHVSVFDLPQWIAAAEVLGRVAERWLWPVQ